MSPLLASAGPSAYWYLTRSTGAVAIVLLTLSVVLGVIDVRRLSTPRWPRFVIDSLHRSVSMLSVVFLLAHIVTAWADSFAPIPLLDAVLPFVGSYRPFWLGLGAVAFDLLLAVSITSIFRERLGHRAWRATHWLAYACWPIALLHTLGTGSDVQSGWLLVLSAACLAAVVVVVGVRAIAGWPEHAGLRVAALAAAGVMPVGLLLWLPSGPLGAGWARRAGTPVSLLASRTGSAGTSTSGSRRPAASRRPAGSPAPGPSAAAVSAPFQAGVSGTIRQGRGPGPGLVGVDIATRLTGSPSRRLRIHIDGQPSSGGGVTLDHSRVMLGTGAAPSLYSGRIVSLNGTRLGARVRSAQGGELSLDVALRIDAGTGTVSGTVAASTTSSGGQ